MVKRKHTKPGNAPKTGANRAKTPQGGSAGGPKHKKTKEKAGDWIYGRHAVAYALANPARRHKRLLATTGALDDLLIPASVQPEVADSAMIERTLPPGSVHQGLALLAEPLIDIGLEASIAPEADLENRIVLLDQVTDPHNVGAVLRSAAAFGAKAVIVQDRHAPPTTGVLAKSASGALEHVALVRVVNLARALETAAKLGYFRVGLDDQGATPIAETDLSGNIALVLGAEGQGLRRLTRQNCDAVVALPTAPDFSTLNISNAAAIALYETSRQATPAKD